jgi:hypothetical protein
MKTNHSTGNILHRLAAVALLFGGAAMCWSILVGPALDQLDYVRGDIAGKQAEIQRLSREVNAIPRLRDRLAALHSQVDAISDLWSRDTPADLSAAMQSSVRVAIAREGGIVQSTVGLPPSAEYGLTHIKIRANAIASMTALVNVIRSFETMRPILIIDDLKLQALNRGNDADEPKLSVEVQLSGYAKGVP